MGVVTSRLACVRRRARGFLDGSGGNGGDCARVGGDSGQCGREGRVGSAGRVGGASGSCGVAARVCDPAARTAGNGSGRTVAIVLAVPNSGTDGVALGVEQLSRLAMPPSPTPQPPLSADCSNQQGTPNVLLPFRSEAAASTLGARPRAAVPRHPPPHPASMNLAGGARIGSGGGRRLRWTRDGRRVTRATTGSGDTRARHPRRASAPRT